MSVCTEDETSPFCLMTPPDWQQLKGRSFDGRSRPVLLVSFLHRGRKQSCGRHLFCFKCSTLEKHLHPGCRRSASPKSWRADLSPVLCKQCELVQRTPPGGREALKRSLLVVLLVLGKLFGPAKESVRTCAPLRGFSLLLHTSELVFCVRPERWADTPPERTDGRTEGGTDGWMGWRMETERPESTFWGRFFKPERFWIGSKPSFNLASVAYFSHKEWKITDLCLIDKLLLDELISSTFFSVQACNFPTPL